MCNSREGIIQKCGESGVNDKRVRWAGGLTFLGSSDNIMNRCKMQYDHDRRGDKGLALTTP